MIRLSFATAVLACCVVGPVLAQRESQPPSPGRGPSQSRQPQRQARGAQQQPAPDPRGTDKAPLVVHVQPTPKTDAETAKEKAKEDRETSAYRWTIGLGFLTGIVGLLQLVAIGIQAKIASRQNTIITNQNAIMTGQRDAADEQSGYMRLTLDETRDANITAREALYLLEGASLQLQEATFDAPENTNNAPEHIRLKWARVNLKWRNYGRSIAKDVLIDFHLGFDESQELRPPTLTQPEIVIAPGQTNTYGFDPLIHLFTEDQVKEILNGTLPLRFWGYVKYSDVFGRSVRVDAAGVWLVGQNLFAWTRYVETELTPPRLQHGRSEQPKA